MLMMSANSGISMLLIYVLLFGFLIYFMMIRPDRNKKKAQEELYASMKPGDTIITTGGFYGVLILIEDDIVIVEFGNNRNCRIPMKKEAIASVEKPDLSGDDE